MSKLSRMFVVLVVLGFLALAGIAYLLLTHYSQQANCDINTQNIAKKDELCAR